MSKVLVDRELLEKHISEIDSWNASMEKIIGKQPDYRWTSLETLRAIIAQPTEAEVDCGDPEHCEWVEDNWPCPTCAALSAVTAERDRLESLLVKTTTWHFAQQIKDRADGKRLDECLSEGIAVLEAERDQLRAEVEELRVLLSKSLPIVEAHAGASHMLEGFRSKRNKWDELVDGIHATMVVKDADKI